MFWTKRPGNPMKPPPSVLYPLSTDRQPTSYESLDDYLQNLSDFYRRFLSHYEQTASNKVVWRAFRSRRQLEIVTEGSLATTTGTFGWRLISPLSDTLFQGSGPVDGPYDLATSTRSELGGYVAPLLLTAALLRFWGLPHRCKFRWIVDSTSAISKVRMVTRPGARPHRQPNNVDLLLMIADLTKELGRPISITWIKGH